MTKEKLITIEVEGGLVVDVSGLPEGYLYKVIDHDCDDEEEVSDDS